MSDEDRWAKLENLLRRVVSEELDSRGIKSKAKIDFVNGKWIGINPEHLEAWGAAYGSVDIETELKKAAAWITSNPEKKPRSQFGRFLNTWFSQTQNRSAIRSIPTRSEHTAPPNLCAYCGLPSIGAVNGYRHCREHTDNAMYGEKPQRFMAGIVPKPVSGS